MKIKCSEPRLAHEYGYGWRFSFHVEEESLSMAKQLVDELRDVYMGADIGKWRARRSLDANAYAWVLIDKLASVRRLTKTEVYRHAIREIGGNSTIVCVKSAAADALCANWQRNGIGWITEQLPSKLDGCTNCVLYTGSSAYDTAQMSILIDSLVQDCKSVGIETLPPMELERMMRVYEKQTNKGDGDPSEGKAAGI